MMLVVFHVGEERYALEARQVVEVLPLLEMKRIPNAPNAVAGVFNYRGRATPAIDLSAMLLGREAGKLLSTRIIVIQYPEKEGKLRPLGLVVERVAEVIRRDREDFIKGSKFADAPCAGPLSEDGHGVLLPLGGKNLLNDRLRDILFCDTLEAIP